MACGFDQAGLAQTGQADQQRMAARQDCIQRQINGAPLSDDPLFNLRFGGFDFFAKRFDFTDYLKTVKILEFPLHII